MRDRVSAAEVAAYRQDGFVVLPSLLSPEELEDWRRTLHEAADRRASRLPTASGDDGAFPIVYPTISSTGGSRV